MYGISYTKYWDHMVRVWIRTVRPSKNAKHYLSKALLFILKLLIQYEKHLWFHFIHFLHELIFLGLQLKRFYEILTRSWSIDSSMLSWFLMSVSPGKLPGLPNLWVDNLGLLWLWKISIYKKKHFYERDVRCNECVFKVNKRIFNLKLIRYEKIKTGIMAIYKIIIVEK